MTDWIMNRVRDLERLRGRTVARWHGVEMALRERGESGSPQFEDACFPGLQLDLIHIGFDDGGVAAIHTYQDDDEWGIWSSVPESPLSDGIEGIWRTRELEELPHGSLSRVDVDVSKRGNIAQVALSFEGGTQILLVAGEIHEENDGSLRFARGDDAILVFRRLSDANAVRWG